ncbi:hypothetical protein Tco_1145214 [Tanacetum coccineum]
MKSGAGDEDFTEKALEEYRAEYGVPFTLLHVWSVLKDYKKMEGEAGDEEEEEVREVRRLVGKDKAKKKAETSSILST